jgi:hypothetical protein
VTVDWLNLRTNAGDANSCGVELLSTVPIHPGLNFYELIVGPFAWRKIVIHEAKRETDEACTSI